MVVPIPFENDLHFQLRKSEKQKDWLPAYIKEIWEVFQKTIGTRSASYRRKIKDEFLHNLASYLRISYKKVKKLSLGRPRLINH